MKKGLLLIFLLCIFTAYAECNIETVDVQSRYHEDTYDVYVIAEGLDPNADYALQSDDLTIPLEMTEMGETGTYFIRDINNPLELPNLEGKPMMTGEIHAEIFKTDNLEGYDYWLYYTPYPGDDEELPFLARSAKGFEFTDEGVSNALFYGGECTSYDCMKSWSKCDPIRYWDCHHLADVDVVKVDDNWFMYFTGCNASSGNGKHCAIGVATSTDGKNWEKHPTPVIDNSLSWESEGGLAEPAVHHDGQYFWMIYNVNYSYFALAKSTDGITWTKMHTEWPVFSKSNDPEYCDHTSISHPELIFKDGKYWMYYLAQDGVDRHLALATSINLIDWTKHPDNPIMSPGIEYYDNDLIYRSSPSIEENGIRLYFSSEDRMHLHPKYKEEYVWDWHYKAYTNIAYSYDDGEKQILKASSISRETGEQIVFGKRDLILTDGTSTCRLDITREMGEDLKLASFTRNKGGWGDQDIHPRLIGDVNDDGKSDIVGFGNKGVYVSTSTGNAFTTTSCWRWGEYGAGVGWDTFDKYPRLLGDVNGDGMDDIIGFRHDGTVISLSTGTGFGAAQYWLSGLTCGKGGWYSMDDFPRIIGDFNNDGMDDIFAFGNREAYISYSTGTEFTRPTYVTSRFTKAATWYSQDIYPRMAGDVNGDGYDDIIGFGQNYVFIIPVYENGLGTTIECDEGFFRGDGWDSQDKFPRFMADVNNDGMDDIVGIWENEIQVGLSDGVYFSDPIRWNPLAMTPQLDWYSMDAFPRAIGDADGDHIPEIIGFGEEGVFAKELVQESIYNPWI